MISDDTEHALFVAQAFLANPNDAAAFQRCLAWKLRWWLVSLPAGVGYATLRAIMKLWIGFPAHRSGVRSAGNGPAMRSAILGACLADQPEKLREFTRASTVLTHTDPKAETAALAVALAAAAIANGSVDHCLEALRQIPADKEWLNIVEQMGDGFAARQTVAEFAFRLGLKFGVSGYCYHSVPVALYAWLRHPDDFRAAMETALNCGGDTDSVGAIVGALAGAQLGKQAIPKEWLGGIAEWPRSVKVLEQVAGHLAEWKATDHSPGPVRYCWPGVLPRNLAFLMIVLGHGFRRMFPPF
jgi:ADP-ribosyl-[dinitrogen reductase] hydrolase